MSASSFWRLATTQTYQKRSLDSQFGVFFVHTRSSASAVLAGKKRLSLLGRGGGASVQRLLTWGNDKDWWRLVCNQMPHAGITLSSRNFSRNVLSSILKLHGEAFAALAKQKIMGNRKRRFVLEIKCASCFWNCFYSLLCFLRRVFVRVVKSFLTGEFAMTSYQRWCLAWTKAASLERRWDAGQSCMAKYVDAEIEAQSSLKLYIHDEVHSQFKTLGSD